MEINDIISKLDSIAYRNGVDELLHDVISDIDGSIVVEVYINVKRPFLIFFSKNDRRIITKWRSKIADIDKLFEEYEMLIGACAQESNRLQNEE